MWSSLLEDEEVDFSESSFDRMRLSDDACFLCGAALSGPQTCEHVFPKWLQNRHDLWNKQLTLLNGTHIRYSQLTIPCCRPCNNEHLSRIENTVRRAVESGYAAAAELPQLVIYQWLGKIFYGILRKELTLCLNRRDASEGTIVTSDLLERFTTLHFFLQSIRQPFEFPERLPFSALVVNLHCPDLPTSYFFNDSLSCTTAALRTGDVGFIFALQDAGLARDTYGRYVEQVAGRKLLRIQFDELYAKVLYQVSLLNRTPHFISAASTDPAVPTSVQMLPIGGYSSLPIVGEWRQADFVDVLALAVRQSFPKVSRDDLYVPPDRVMTWMNDEEGSLILADENGRRITP